MDYSKYLESGEASDEEKKYDVTTKWYSLGSLEPQPNPGYESDSDSATDEEEHTVGLAKAANAQPMPPLHPIPKNGYPQPSYGEQEEFQAQMPCPHLTALPRLHPADQPDNILPTYPAEAVQQPSCLAGPSTPPTEDQVNYSIIHPPMWAGYLILKSNYIPVQMNYLYGNPTVGKTALPMNIDGSTEPLKISFRMKLNSNQAIDFQQKMQDESKHCMLLALANGPTIQDIHREANKLHRVIVKYLYRKKVAGIISIVNMQTGQELEECL